MRGVAVSTDIIQRLLEREWIKKIGEKDVPGRPSLFGTTPEFLERLGLDSLDDLPSLAQYVPGSDVVEALEQGLRVTPLVEVRADVLPPPG